MVKKRSPNETASLSYTKYLYTFLPLITGIIYYFSNPKPQNYYDYTFRVAENFFRGGIGFIEKPPSWLNEFVPFEGFYYSVFPLGSVLSMIPFAFFKVIGLISEMPGTLISAMLAAIACFLMQRIASKYELPMDRQILLTLAILFGTFTWTNLTMAGAWQLALGFAIVGQLGAIYYAVYDRRPLIAGLFFALAFGNRTEILLTAPVVLYLLKRRNSETQREESKTKEPNIERKSGSSSDISYALRISAVNISNILYFCTAPFVLGIATLIYNYVRFQSFTDFGYARIPGVLSEPWYKYGIFSIYYIPGQAWEMLWRPWELKSKFPYLVPNGFSSSILLSSPFLLFALRPGACDRALKYASWAAIIILTVLLWIHGNSGGWQFGYRYAMVLLPWLLVILLENSPKKITPLEWTAYIFSFIANLYATWLFHWTNYLKP